VTASAWPACYRHGCDCGLSPCAYAETLPSHEVQQAFNAYCDRDWTRLDHWKRFMGDYDKRELNRQIEMYTADVRARGGK
jgi:hypothetical protein